MTTKTIDCIDCGESVPYGRLSCPACGALLASVGTRPAVATNAAPETVPAGEPEPEPEPLLLPDDDIIPAADPWAIGDPEPVLAARPYQRHVIEEPGERSYMPPPPSAYRPSTLSLSSAVAAGPVWPAPNAGAAPPSPEPAATAITARSRIGRLDPARFVEIAGWFVVVGATMAVLGFLLPWSAVVIGAGSGRGYLHTWGLASPTHLVVLAVTMLVLALGILRTAVPIWLRAGVVPLALGSLLIGLIWPYQVGPLGADVGALVVALGALALVIGGTVAIWATRHVEVQPVV